MKLPCATVILALVANDHAMRLGRRTLRARSTRSQVAAGAVIIWNNKRGRVTDPSCPTTLRYGDLAAAHTSDNQSKRLLIACDVGAGRRSCPGDSGDRDSPPPPPPLPYPVHPTVRNKNVDDALSRDFSSLQGNPAVVVRRSITADRPVTDMLNQLLMLLLAVDADSASVFYYMHSTSHRHRRLFVICYLGYCFR